LSPDFNWYANHIEQLLLALYFPYVRPFFIEKATDNSGDFKINNEVYLAQKLRPTNLLAYITRTRIFLKARNIIHDLD